MEECLPTIVPMACVTQVHIWHIWIQLFDLPLPFKVYYMHASPVGSEWPIQATYTLHIVKSYFISQLTKNVQQGGVFTHTLHMFTNMRTTCMQQHKIA